MNLLQVQLSLYKCRCRHLQAGVRYLLLHLLRSVAVSALLQAESALLRSCCWLCYSCRLCCCCRLRSCCWLFALNENCICSKCSTCYFVSTIVNIIDVLLIAFEELIICVSLCTCKIINIEIYCCVTAAYNIKCKCAINIL